jgi:hypothetical protein
LTGCEFGLDERETPLSNIAEEVGNQPDRKADGRYKQPDGDE